MGKLYKILDGLKPMMMMVTVQLALTGVNILYKLEGNNGVSMPVLISYRFLFATATVVPLALILDRKKRPKMSWKIIMHAFVCALFGGSLAQNLYAESLVLTSATFIAAITNLIPALTLILAVIFRMEALGLKTMAGKAKLSGTVLGIGGAMLLTFYKGSEVNFMSTHIDLLHKTQAPAGHVAEAHLYSSTHPSVLGLLLALTCCFSISFGLIIQTKMSHIYPCHYSSTALISIIGSVQAIVYALCVERDRSKWKLGWNLTLLTAAYMGILASGIMWVFTMLCVRMRGPLYVSVFNPLLLVLVAIAGSLFLNEKMHLGSVLGAAVIVCGLYLVLWGKGKEMKKMNLLMASKLSSTVPTMEETTATESFKGLILPSNVVVVTPNFVPEFESSEIFFDQEEEKEKQDLEANVSSSTNNISKS